MVYNVNDINQEAGAPTNNQYRNLTVLSDNGHPLIPRPSVEYIKRPVHGNNTDVSLVTKLMNDPDFQVLLVGETGVGKNHLIKHICDKTNRPMVRVNFGEGVDYDSVVGGFVPDDHGGFEFNYRALAQSAKHGWTFVADEINAAPPELTLPLNQVTEDMDSRHLTIPETGEIIEPHEQFQFVATMNPEYAGTKRLNDAFKNRFYTVQIDHLEPDAEVGILKQRTNIQQHASEEAIKKVVEIANTIRAQSRSQAGEINTPISPRDLIKVGRMVEIMSLREALDMIFVGGADPLDQDAIRDLIKTEKGI